MQLLHLLLQLCIEVLPLGQAAAHVIVLPQQGVELPCSSLQARGVLWSGVVLSVSACGQTHSGKVAACKMGNQVMQVWPCK